MKFLLQKRTTKEEYEKYANSFDQYIHLDDKHKFVYVINGDEIVRRIINGYGQWTPFYRYVATLKSKYNKEKNSKRDE